ncbi:Dof zinc finger protein DOF3.2, partial [Frankliniella fusca]
REVTTERYTESACCATTTTSVRRWWRGGGAVRLVPSRSSKRPHLASRLCARAHARTHGSSAMPFMKQKERARRESVSRAMKERFVRSRALKAAAQLGEGVGVEEQEQDGLAVPRVVDLRQFALDMWCDSCNVPLSLRFLEEEETVGLASRFTVRCHQCLLAKKIDSSRRTTSPSTDGDQAYDINRRAAEGCKEAGIGDEQFNKLLSAVSLPTLRGITAADSHDRSAENNRKV